MLNRRGDCKDKKILIKNHGELPKVKDSKLGEIDVATKGGALAS